MQYIHGKCKICGDNGKLERHTTNHLLHLFITVFLGLFTMGVGSIVWIIVWILLSIRIGGWRCTRCGSTKVSSILFEGIR